MMDKFYLNIIVDAESSVYDGIVKSHLSNFYYDAFKSNSDKIGFYANLLEVIKVFEEDLDSQYHKISVLMDIVPEHAYFRTVSIDLSDYNPDKQYWRFGYNLEAYRIEQHKKSIILASKRSELSNEEFDSKHFNFMGYHLYNYLVKEYVEIKREKVRYSNLWRFMREQHKSQNGKVIFRFTQKEFNSFVGIKNLKYQITGHKYEDIVEPLLQDLTSEFFKSLN